MGALKDRLRQQITDLEAEIVRIDADAVRFKATVQARLDTLKQADRALTPDLEALIVGLQRAGVDIFK